VEALVIRGISDMVEGKTVADRGGSQELASAHAAAFAFQVLANFQPEERFSYREAKPTVGPTQYNIAGDYVEGDKVMGNKVVREGNSGQPPQMAVSNSRRSFYEGQLARKREDLAAVERDLAIAGSAVQARRLEVHAEQLLAEIEQLAQGLEVKNTANQEVSESIARMKAMGKPTYYAENGKLIRENADGRKFECRLLPDGGEEIITEVYQ
jgi:hypothetical protein